MAIHRLINKRQKNKEKATEEAGDKLSILNILRCGVTVCCFSLPPSPWHAPFIRFRPGGNRTTSYRISDPHPTIKSLPPKQRHRMMGPYWYLIPASFVGLSFLPAMRYFVTFDRVPNASNKQPPTVLVSFSFPNKRWRYGLATILFLMAKVSKNTTMSPLNLYEMLFSMRSRHNNRCNKMEKIRRPWRPRQGNDILVWHKTMIAVPRRILFA